MAVFLVVSTGALVLASVLDGPVWRAASHVDAAVSLSLWWQALRSFGYLPVWLVVACALFFLDRWVGRPTSPAAHRALLLAASVIFAGCMGEVLKMLLRRLRPDAAGGEYAWRPFLEDPFSTSGLGLPSGHAMMAFAAAWVLCRLWPAAAGLWIAAACGCAVTRILSQAHFVSDTVLAAAVAFAVVRFGWGCSLYLQEKWGQE